MRFSKAKWLLGFEVLKAEALKLYRKEGGCGLADFEFAKRYGESESFARDFRKWLAGKGFLRRSGRRTRANSAGKQCQVWIATEVVK